MGVVDESLIIKIGHMYFTASILNLKLVDEDVWKYSKLNKNRKEGIY